MNLLLADGAPGIACPSISSLSGADYAVIITEPSVSGFHDMKRIADLIRGLRIPFGAVINKFDIRIETTSEIEDYCREYGIDLLGRIPFDHIAVEAARKGVPVIKYPDSEAGKAIIQVKNKLENILTEEIKGEKK